MPYLPSLGVRDAGAYVAGGLISGLTAGHLCHNLHHPLNVRPSDTGLRLLSAWFDVQCYEGHAEVGAGITAEFVRYERLSTERIGTPGGCILPNRMPRRPRKLLERSIFGDDPPPAGRRSNYCGRNGGWRPAGSFPTVKEGNKFRRCNFSTTTSPATGQGCSRPGNQNTGSSGK